MLRSRLAAKIALLIVVVMIVGFGVSTVITIEREHALLLEQSKQAARRLAATLVASIEGAMVQERPDVTRMIIQELRASRPVEQLAIYRRNGVEAFTDLATAEEVNRAAGLSPEVLENIRRMAQPPGAPMTGPLFEQALQTLAIQESYEQVAGATYYTLHYPIENQPKCQGCHGSDHKVRAVVRVGTSMESWLAAMRRQRNQQILIALVTIAAAAGVLTVAMRRVVVRPIDQLAATARRVGEGDFTARAPEGAHDEIGSLGAAFNEMTAHLAQARADLEAKNTELETALQGLRESRERLAVLEQLKGELSKFVPDSVKRLLEQNPAATELEKKTVEVSVLFLDIVGYTGLAEQLDPRRLNQLVQIYFSSFLEIILGHHGDINETAGDGLMVIFQADRAARDHALDAARAALAIHRRTQELREEYEGVYPAVALHMGINSGEALVGATKLGGAGSQRWTFTASGPTTNLAARLANLAEAGDIVVGATTAARISQHFVLENLGERQVKNVSQPIQTFRLILPGIYEKIA